MLFNMIFKTIKAKPARAVLTIISIVIGVTSVLLINTVSSAGTEVISNELNSLGIDCISITSQNTEDFILNNKDIENLSKINGVKDVYGFYSHGGGVAVDDQTGNVIFWGLSDPDNHLLSIELLHGEFINENDILNRVPVCIIDKETAVKYFGVENAVGKDFYAYIGDSKIKLTVIGVSGKSDGILSEVINGFIPEIVYTSSNLLQYMSDTDALSQISVTMDDMSQKNIDDGILEIKRTLMSSHNNVNVSIENLTENKNSIINIISMIRLLLTTIAGISVVVACIGITNIMFISVTERKREIGIKKAIGATNTQIGFEFLLEGVSISIFGCILGILLTSIMLFISRKLFPIFTMSLPLKTIFIALVVSIFLGSVFSLLPSIKAARQTPVNCLKNE